MSVEIFAAPETVAHACADRFVLAVAETLAAADVCRVALAGGSTPKAAFALLAAAPYRARVDWARLEVYFGDERCVGPDHPDSNYRMARLALLDHVSIDPARVHRIAGETPPADAARAYEAELRRIGPAPALDLLLLGMGPDGHTASLFPGTAALDERTRLVVENFVPKLDSWRVTLTAPMLSAARRTVITAVGVEKAEALRSALEAPPGAVPIQLVRPAAGEPIWLVDRAAASLLKSPS